MCYLERISIVFLALCCCVAALGQDPLFMGLVVDSATRSALAGVHISSAAHGDVRTDRNGEFELLTKDPIEISLTYTGYIPRTVQLTRGFGTKDQPYIIGLQQAVKEFEAVVIRPGPQVVYQRPDLHVGAYHVNSDGIWVLVYEKPKLWHSAGRVGEQVFKGARMHLLDTLFNERATIELPGEVLALYHDREQRPIIEGRDQAWYAHVENAIITLQPVDKKVVHEGILPWTDSVPGYLLGSNLSRSYPAFDHIAYDPNLNEATAFCSIEDEFLVELFRSEYKYMSGADKVIAMNMETELGVDKEIIAGYMTRFYENLYFKVPYAPLYRINDTLCVFDKYKQAIRRYTLDMEPVGEVPFSESCGRERWDLLVQDASTGKVYAQFSKGPITTLRAIDTNTGAFGKAFALGHPFPEEVQVNDGYVYFVYRTYGSLQRRTLYRESLQ